MSGPTGFDYDVLLKLLKEARFLIEAEMTSCPGWIEGVGDCNKGSCHFCRQERCAERIRMVLEGGIVEWQRVEAAERAAGLRTYSKGGD